MQPTCAVWIDISRPVGPRTPVWPGDPPIDLSWASSISQGGGVNVGRWSGTTHAGTHADAPLHVDPGGTPIDGLPLEAFVGGAHVIDLSPGMGPTAPDAPITADDLEARLEEGARRILLRTDCEWEGGFPNHFRALSPEAAEWCVQRGLRLVGTDAPSVDPLHATDLAAHRTLLAGGVAILESLLLADVEPGHYELVALPLRLIGADASPVRAAIRHRRDGHPGRV